MKQEAKLLVQYKNPFCTDPNDWSSKLWHHVMGLNTTNGKLFHYWEALGTKSSGFPSHSLYWLFLILWYRNNGVLPQLYDRCSVRKMLWSQCQVLLSSLHDWLAPVLSCFAPCSSVPLRLHQVSKNNRIWNKTRLSCRTVKWDSLSPQV